jgi:hypothetical protein
MGWRIHGNSRARKYFAGVKGVFVSMNSQRGWLNVFVARAVQFVAARLVTDSCHPPDLRPPAVFPESGVRTPPDQAAFLWGNTYDVAYISPGRLARAGKTGNPQEPLEAQRHPQLRPERGA